MHAANTNALLMQGISTTIHARWLSFIAKIFISICALTSFLGVSICLVDFIADGLNQQGHHKKKWPVYALCYLPPLLIVLLSPGIFIHALAYAGIWCLLLLIILPMLMLYIGRYHKAQQQIMLLPGGKIMILSLLFIGIYLLIWNFISYTH